MVLRNFELETHIIGSHVEDGGDVRVVALTKFPEPAQHGTTLTKES